MSFARARKEVGGDDVMNQARAAGLGWRFFWSGRAGPMLLYLRQYKVAGSTRGWTTDFEASGKFARAVDEPKIVWLLLSLVLIPGLRRGIMSALVQLLSHRDINLQVL
jgi:hypothetical protein